MPTTNAAFVGIDFSMSCPAITILIDQQLQYPEHFRFADCHCFYLSERVPKPCLQNVVGIRIEEFSCNEERFDAIANWALETLKIIPNFTTAHIFMEGYAFGGKGKVFEIGELTGLLKHNLWQSGYDFTLVPPTVIKKFASGKGTAKKEQMHDSFVKETGIDLMKLYQPKAKKVGSPVGDIVDSYYICKFGYSQTINMFR